MPRRGLPKPRRQREASAFRAKLWSVAAVAISGPGWDLELSGAFQQVGPVSPLACCHAGSTALALAELPALGRVSRAPQSLSQPRAGPGLASWWSQHSSSPPCPTQTPSSDFWKELCLALPRKVSFQGTMGDPQTQLQEDKDPMLILHSSYLDSGGDLHPDGDLGTGPCHPGDSFFSWGGTDVH